MRYALVVPALNEEEAIAAILRRCLAARKKILEQTPVRSMTIVFVNDGCTDRTQEIVDQPEFAEVVKVRFERNRGYGAAIKAGWKAADADLLGFIDADGTWDPDFSVPLLKRLLDTGADVVLANRMNPQSKMPPVRKLGNRIFAGILRLLSGRRLADTASGFRIVRRASLRRIAPLPDRLHFTPAMSSICLMDSSLRIEEVALPYEERIGRSKLNVVRDGLRFLDIMLFSAAFYRPARVLGTAAAVVLLLLGAAGLALLRTERPGAGLAAIGAGIIIAAFFAWTAWLIRRIREGILGPLVGKEMPNDAAALAVAGSVLAGVGLLAFLVVVLGPFATGPAVIELGPIIPAAVAGLGAALALLGLLTRVLFTVRAKANAMERDEFAREPRQPVAMDTGAAS